jgi:hypothetical protein
VEIAMNDIRKLASLPMLIALVAGATQPGLCQAGAEPRQGTTPTDAGPAPHWRFLRHDAESLKQLGGGDLVAGMNKLGEVGYELFIVTSASDRGATAWMYFRQSPWVAPMPRPQLEYLQLDDDGIAALGGHNYGDGLAKLENEGWQLVAITTTKDGQAGWTFFMRQKESPMPGGVGVRTGAPSDPVASDEPRVPRPAPAGSDFSTPAAAANTLVAAATARDADLLSHCFAGNAATEFQRLRTKTASAKDLDDLAALFRNGAVGEERISGAQATVRVSLDARNEEIELAKTSGGWKVVDF